MRYLVTTESVDSGETPPPAEQAAFLEAIVVPSLQALKEWEDGGRIRAPPRRPLRVPSREPVRGATPKASRLSPDSGTLF